MKFSCGVIRIAEVLLQISHVCVSVLVTRVSCNAKTAESGGSLLWIKGTIC